MPRSDHESLTRLLEQVSRSFYLTLRVLPVAVRPQIGLAYLLARTTDTIADTRLVPVERRLGALNEMRLAIIQAAEGRAGRPPDFGELAAAQAVPAGRGSAAERVLLEKAALLLSALGGIIAEDRQRISELLKIIISGQEMDLIRFGSASADYPVALESEAELDEYTYHVAGCVGEFWTRMCRAHLFPDARLDDSLLLAGGVRYGKGLQLVNILRDLPGDLRQGRCYIPASRLAGCGLKPADLLNQACLSRFRPVINTLLDEAEENLKQGWDYANALPYSQIRVRLACAWPALIGAKTVARLRVGNVLDERTRIKVSRPEIRRLVLSTLLCYPFPSCWRRLFERTRSERLL